MPSIREALNVFLKTDAALNALVGQRIYSLAAPADTTYPYVKYSGVSSVPDVLLNGTFSGTIDARWQFDVYAITPKDAELVRDRLLDLLLQKRMDVIVPVDNGTVDLEIKAMIPQTYGDPFPDFETDKFRCVVDVRVVYQRA